MMKKVSIIVAAYNVENYICRCIRSLINQTYKNLEIIVVNDKSTDSTEEKCYCFQKKDKRIIIISKDINEGLSEARNSGLEFATGEYVTFVYGDDFIEAETVDACVKRMDDTNADGLVFGAQYDRKDGSIYKMPLISSFQEYTGKRGMKQYFKECIGSLPASHYDRDIGFTPWGRFYKNKIIKNNGLKFISERKIIYEDLMFFLTVTPYINKVTILNKPYYHYCENEYSLTKNCDIKRFNRVKNMYEYLKKNYYNYLFKDTEINIRFKRTIISYIRLSVMQLAGNDNCIKTIKLICRDSMTREILDGYPFYKLPARQAVFAFLLKYNMAVLLKVVCNLYSIK